eukprot:2073850-Pleurochrysis_carterae.AAC.1
MGDSGFGKVEGFAHASDRSAWASLAEERSAKDIQGRGTGGGKKFIGTGEKSDRLIRATRALCGESGA